MAKETNPLDVLRAFVDRCGSQKAAASKLACSPQFVGNMVNGRKKIPIAMLEKLGLRVVAVKS